MPARKGSLERIDEIRNLTAQDVAAKLDRYHKCLVVRPTGYGKTFLLADMSRLYRHVLYLYPAEAVAAAMKRRYASNGGEPMDPETAETLKTLKSFGNVDTMTYAKLVRLGPADFAAMDYDLVIADEAHRLGAEKTVTAMAAILSALPDAKLLGATATPTRPDCFDVPGVFFSNVTSFPYTLHDAFKDGLLKRPYYCYCTYDAEEDLRQAALTAGESLDDPTVVEVLKKTAIEVAAISGMDKVIGNVCGEYGKYCGGTDYMKFIVFFADMAHMDAKLPDVVSWFSKAFPKHKIGTLKISSRNKYESENVKKLDSLKPPADPKKDKRIDLIACIDMLNMGYHVDDLTGIMMYRGTSSDIIFVQQFGRALSSGSGHPCIVLDVVDNLHRKAVFELAPKTAHAPRKPRTKTRKAETPWTVGPDGGVYGPSGEPAPYTVMDDGRLADSSGIATPMRADPSTGRVVNENEEAHDCGTISKEDVNEVTPAFLTATGHMATYREIIAKAVAEPMSQRIRSVILSHFQQWCETEGIAYPITEKEIAALMCVPAEDFLSYFRGMLKAAGIQYPIDDMDALLAYGEDESERIPIRIYAKWRNVSVRAITDALLADGTGGAAA